MTQENLKYGRDEDGYKTIDAKTLVEDCYRDFGNYVNQFRLIPHIGDGLITVYRRVLLAAMPYNNLTKTMSIVGDCARDWHPHGDSSINPVVSKMIRRGLLRGKGNHGAQLLEFVKNAHPRYTETATIPEVKRALMDLTKYAPHFQNEAHSNEPYFFITPVPLALVYGHTGVGLGCATRIPAFTYDSLIEAYEKDDYRCLKLAYGLEMLPDSELESLWLYGTGRLGMRMKVDYEWSKDDDTYVSVISGSTEMFTPALGKFDDHQDAGRVFIRNESKKEVRVVIGRCKGIKVISNDRVYEIALQAATHRRKFDIKANYNGMVRRIGIRDWLHVTMGLYKGAYEKWQADAAQNVRDRIYRHKITPFIVERLSQDVEDLRLVDEVNNDFIPKQEEELRDATLEDIKAVGDRPLRMIRQTDFAKEIVKLQSDLEDILAEKVEDSIKSVTSVLSRG